MKTFMIPTALIACALIGSSCAKNSAAPQDAQSCPGESVLAVYQNQEAVVTMTQKDTYCLVAAPADIANNSYRLENYLVPVPALPSQYQVVGLHVIFSGRKKSCYGLTTLPNLMTSFGYKLEVDAIQVKEK